MGEPRETSRLLLIIRHADRAKTLGKAEEDGLSDLGRTQEAALAKRFEIQFAGTKARVLSSPKRRCVETVAGIARAAGATVKIDPLLDEQRPGESPADLTRRIREFLVAWVGGTDELIVAASHGDWIPEFTRMALGTEVQLSKGGWLLVQLDPDGALSLREILQEM